MEEYLQQLVSELLLDKLLIVLVGVIVIASITRLIKRRLYKYVKEKTVGTKQGKQLIF